MKRKKTIIAAFSIPFILVGYVVGFVSVCLQAGYFNAESDIVKIVRDN